MDPQILFDVMASVQPFTTLIGATLIVFTVAKFGFRMARGESTEGTFGTLIPGVVMISVPIMLPLLTRGLMSIVGEDSPTTEPPASQPPTVSAPASIDLSWVPGVLLAVGAVAAVGVGLFHYYSKSLRPSLLRNRSEAASAATLVAEAKKTLKWVVLDSASYETDLAKQIDYPMMTDVADPLVGKYVREMRHAQELERALVKKPGLADAERFSSTVTGLKVSYEAAVRKSEKVRWSGFTAAEQKRLKDARIALDLIQDSSTTPEQRNAQYRRIAKLLDGLIVLTDQVRQSLAAWVPMLALESAPGRPREENQVSGLRAR
jgi:hypothetical protein